jgi:hypothetical protein
LDVPFEPQALNYRSKEVAGKGLGDPVGVKKHQRPVTSSKDTWGAELAANQLRYEVVARQIAQVDPKDLETWGYPISGFWKPMEEADPASWAPRKIELDNFQAQRRVLRWLRGASRPGSGLHRNLSKLRYFVDVVIRDNFADYRHVPSQPPVHKPEDEG